MTRIAGLASGRGRTLRRIHDRRPGGATVAAVVSDRRDAPVLDWAADRGVPTTVVEPGDDGALLAAVEGADPDLVCLDGFRDDLGPSVLGAIPRAVACHPSLLPSFPGPDPTGDAVAAGVAVSGCTVYVVTPGDGAGPIVTQEPVPVYADDDGDSLARRIRDAGEARAYLRAVRWFAEGRVAVDPDDGTVTVEGDADGDFPARRPFSADRYRSLRYGENPHQAAAVYVDHAATEPGVVGAEELNPDAKALSYNNYNDADAALDLVKEFDRPAVAVIKHANPAGCAVAETVVDAYERALATDPMSAFGGIVACNRECDADTAASIVESFKEVVVAPGYADGALETLREREDLRVLGVDPLGERTERLAEKPLVGGRLIQERDLARLGRADLEIVTEREPTPEEVEAMLFAWPVVKHVKSNGIVFARGTETVGIGMGQVSRVDAVRLAAMKAEEHAEGKSAAGAVMASDAFFPFPDGIEAAADAGVEAVVQPGGSVNDEAVIEAADDLGLAMAFTGTRCFRHG